LGSDSTLATCPVFGVHHSIDVSKATLQLALLKGDSRLQKKKVTNDPSGLAELSQWLSQQKVSSVHACLEATNTYGHLVSKHLYQQGHPVSVVNPSRIQGFVQSQMS
jgi:transposase